jgi:hypothetical protein
VGKDSGEVACLIVRLPRGRGGNVERKTKRKVGAENRNPEVRKRAMRKRIGPETQTWRSTDRGLERSRSPFDTAKLIEQSTWHARAAIPAPQIRRKVIRIGSRLSQKTKAFLAQAALAPQRRHC